MEIMVRVAIDKYFKSGIAKTINESIRKLLIEDSVISWLKEFDST
jgi:hypothetical protein